MNKKYFGSLRLSFILCLAAICALTLLIFAGFFVFGDNGIFGKIVAPTVAINNEPTNKTIQNPADEKTILTQNIAKYEKYLSSPYMISITQQSPIPSDYKVELVALKEFPAVSLEPKAAEELNRFIADAKAAGIKFTVYSGYRTPEDQQKVYDEKYAGLKNMGYTDEELIASKTRLTTALPNYSEHHTGLAVDMAKEKTESSPDILASDFYEYAMENLYKYGFILSYPDKKIAVTGYDMMPWHFRYVGDVEVAKSITEKKITLMEYIDYLQNQIKTAKTRLSELG